MNRYVWGRLVMCARVYVVFSLLCGTLLGLAISDAEYLNETVDILWAPREALRRAFVEHTLFVVGEDNESKPTSLNDPVKLMSVRYSRDPVEGWSVLQLEVAAHDEVLDDITLSFAAGYLEGWTRAKPISDKIRLSLEKLSPCQMAYAREAAASAEAMASEHAYTSRHGSGLERCIAQLHGIADGASAHTGASVSFEQVFASNMLEELDQAASDFCDEVSLLPPSRSVGFIRRVPNDLIIGHTTHAPYDGISYGEIKTYVWSATRTIYIVTSAGCISSTEGFGVVSHDLVFVKTTLPSFNEEKPPMSDRTLPLFIRLAVAALVSNTALEFVKVVSEFSAPSANAELLVLDVKEAAQAVLESQPLPVGSLLLLDEVRSISAFQDVGVILNAKGYVGTVGLPTLHAAVKASEIDRTVSQTGSLYNRWEAPIVKKIAHGINDVDTVADAVRLLQRSAWRQDASSLEPWCADASSATPSCVRELNPYFSIAPRGDLYKAGEARTEEETRQSYRAPYLRSAQYGAINAKATSLVEILRSLIMVHAGPASDPAVAPYAPPGHPATPVSYRSVTIALDPSVMRPRVVRHSRASLRIILVVAILSTLVALSIALLAHRRNTFVFDAWHPGYVAL